MRASFSTLLTGAAMGCLAIVQPAQAAVHRFHLDHVLGTSFALTVNGVDQDRARMMRDAALAEIERLDAVLSGWRADSELARLNDSSHAMIASPDLYRVIDQCEAWRAASAGAFSARIGAARAAWQDGAKADQRPDAAKLGGLSQSAESAAVRLDAVTRTIDRAGVTFAIDGLAKGYIIDAALNAAMAAAPDAHGVMLDIGGDLACRGVAPNGAAWKIGLAGAAHPDNTAPSRAVAVLDKAVATSGAGARDLRVQSRDIGHTLVPATGQPASGRSVTVIADRADHADAMATALGVMPLHEGLTLAVSNGASARIVEPDGVVHTTPGWSEMLTTALSDRSSPAPYALWRIADTAPPRGKAWPAGFAVDIAYEIPPPPSGRAKVPYVAIWITDEGGKLVRTIYHLGNRPRRFLDSNYVWYAALTAAGQTIDSVTRPSRMPGRYTATWDGKNDAGVALPQGRYTINIEMSREHGGHGVQSMPVTIGAAPATAAAAAGDESGPASVRYGPRSASAAAI